MRQKLDEIINSGDRDLTNITFCEAAKNGELECMQILYETQCVDPDANQNEAIRKAAESGHLDVVKYLSTLPDVDPTAKGHEAILIATLYEHHEITDFLSTLPCYNPFTADITVEKRNELIGILTEDQLQRHIDAAIWEKTIAGLSFLFFKESPFNTELIKDIKQKIVSTAYEVDNQKFAP